MSYTNEQQIKKKKKLNGNCSMNIDILAVNNSVLSEASM